MKDMLYGHGDGFLTQDGHRIFPIGFYEHPADDDALRDMAEAGVNLIRCGNTDSLDRAQAHGMMGWVPLALRSGATSEFQEHVRTLAAHPALAVWEGPDEVVWSFTAYSGLWKQDQLAVFPNKGECVSITARRTGRDWLIVLVNEDEHAHMGVEITGLDALKGAEFVELYGDEKTAVSDGSFITRMRPFEVKLFATHRKWEAAQREGRDFAE